MTRTLFDPPLDLLERHFQALQERAASLPGASRQELETALQELSQAIAALRADREAEAHPSAASPSPCEAILRHVFSAIPDLLTIHDRDFNTIMSNWHGYESLPEAERRGQPKCYRVYHHRDRPCDNCQALEVLATGQPVKVEKVNPVDGRVREVSAYPIRDESGRVVLVVEHVRDITERHLAAEALRASEGRFRTLIEDSPESLFLIDVQGTILAASRVAARRLGKNLEEIIGASLFDLFPPGVAARRREFVEQAVATGRSVRFEDARGNFYFDNHINPILDAEGKVSMMSILAIDITDRKHAEQALKEKTRLTQILLDAFPCVALLLRPQTREIIASNAAAVKVGAVPGTQCFSTWGQRQDPCPWCLAPTVWATGEAQHLEVEALGIFWDAYWIPVAEDLYMHFAFDITARKQAEREIQRLASFPQMNPQPVLEMDIDGRITYYNQAALKALGKMGKEEDLKNFLPDDLQEILATAKQTGERHFQREVVVNGAVFLENVYFAEQFNAVRLYAVDITARKQAEEALAAHLQFLQLLLDTIPNPIFFKDAQGAYLGCNKAFEDYLGVTRQEIVGKSVYDLSPKELADEYHRMDLEAFQTTGTQVYESRVQAADGAWRHVVFHKATFPDHTGVVGGLVGIILDITGLKRTEAELRESEQRFRLMAETIQDVFWIATPEIGKTLYVSPAYEQIWGRTREELYGNPQAFAEAIHPEDRERVRSEIAAAQAQSLPWSHEYRIIKPDGAVRWLQDRGFPVRDDQGRVILITGVATDVTEHQALEQQLLQAQKMEAVGRLAGGVAHDFNNLLMAIMGYGELMRAKILKGDPLYGHLENILKAGDRATALTQQLLTFSRQKIAHPQAVDLNRVVLDLEPMLRRLIGEDLDLEVVTDRRAGAVKADPGQMGQIIMNLVVNARDAMPQGGRLTLKTAPLELKKSRHTRFGLAPPGAYVMLVVADTGVGMDEATQAHVFEPFFTTKEPGKGTGLGLSTVYGIVRQSGGYLDLESKPEAGSTFTIYLPRLEAIVEPPKAKIPITASFRGEETVLLVEDEDVLRGLLAKFLRLYGYSVLEARHGGEALLTCERHQGPIHLMVTDVVMPQMSGRELADRLTPLRPEMKVLYMSGYTEDAVVQHGVADLSVAFLQKPFKPIELARLVYAVLHPPVSQ